MLRQRSAALPVGTVGLSAASHKLVDLIEPVELAWGRLPLPPRLLEQQPVGAENIGPGGSSTRRGRPPRTTRTRVAAPFHRRGVKDMMVIGRGIEDRPHLTETRERER